MATHSSITHNYFMPLILCGRHVSKEWSLNGSNTYLNNIFVCVFFSHVHMTNRAFQNTEGRHLSTLHRCIMKAICDLNICRCKRHLGNLYYCWSSIAPHVNEARIGQSVRSNLNKQTEASLTDERSRKWSRAAGEMTRSQIWGGWFNSLQILV